MNPNTPANILEKFASENLYADDERGVCRFIAENPNTPINVLKKLAVNGGGYIRSLVDKNLSRLANKFEKTSGKEQSNHFRKSSKDINMLKRRAVDRSFSVRMEVAESPNTPANILVLLSIDENINVRASVAKNPTASTSILEKLAINECSSVERKGTESLRIIGGDDELYINESNLVFQNIMSNPQCTYKIKETIFKNFAKSQTPSFSRVALFLSDYAESSVLAENCNSISWLERYAIACNHKTPKDILKLLAQDGNRIVRATAKESLERR